MKAEGTASATEVSRLLRELPTGLRVITEDDAPGSQDRFLEYLLAERERERKPPPTGGLTIVIPGLDKLIGAFLGNRPPPAEEEDKNAFRGTSWP